MYKSTRCPTGNRHMRRILNQAANDAVKHKGSIFDVVYRRLVPRLGHGQTIGAITHRLYRLIWIILHQGVSYEERGPNWTSRTYDFECQGSATGRQPDNSCLAACDRVVYKKLNRVAQKCGLTRYDALSRGLDALLRETEIRNSALKRNIKSPSRSEVFRRTMGQVSRNYWATVSPEEKRRRAQNSARARWGPNRAVSQE